MAKGKKKAKGQANASAAAMAAAESIADDEGLSEEEERDLEAQALDEADAATRASADTAPPRQGAAVDKARLRGQRTKSGSIDPNLPRASEGNSTQNGGLVFVGVIFALIVVAIVAQFAIGN